MSSVPYIKIFPDEPEEYSASTHNNYIETNIVEERNLTEYPRFTPPNTSHFTLFSHTSPHNPLPENNSFLVSFDKFHVTKISKSGYNKIYDFRRAKSFFFEVVDHHHGTNQLHLRIHTNDYHMSSKPISYTSTSKLPNAKFQISKALQHFFSAQRVIPRRIQKKYFNFIRSKLLERIDIIKSRVQKIDDRNYETKTFFNFSYKKYRFYFGIFIPCPFKLKVMNLSTQSLPCAVPSPIVRSCHRYGCGQHLHKLHQDLCLDRVDNSTRAKVRHANLLYDRWKRNIVKNVRSLRTGVSYNVKYVARDLTHILTTGHKHMYSKKFYGFKFNPSENPRTAKRQSKRFDRSRRRIFKKQKGKLQSSFNRAELLAIARRNRFLLLPTQRFNSSIQHLKHNKTRTRPCVNAFTYMVPHACSQPNKLAEEVTVSSNDLPEFSNEPIYTVMNYNPKPNMFIPHKYRDIIPPDPIYDEKGIFILPGSRSWFTYMYNREKKMRIQADEARYAKQLRDEQALQVTRIAQRRKEFQDEAAFNGTSRKHYEKRQRQINSATTLNNDYDRRMDIFSQELLKYEDDLEETQRIHQLRERYLKEFPCFNRPYEKFTPSNRYSKNHEKGYYKNSCDLYLSYDSPYTSDDTQAIESRPLKRDVKKSHINFGTLPVAKRICQGPPSDYSTEAGPSNDL